MNGLIQCVVLGCDDLFLDLESTLFSQFLPVLFGSSITPAERRLFSLPAKFGGLGILDPVQSASGSYQASVHATSVLTAAIREGLTFNLESHVNNVLSVQHQEAIFRDACYSQLFNDLLLEFDAYHQQAYSLCQGPEYFRLADFPATCKESV